MNINPVSFGRMIKVNAPIEVARRMATLINQEDGDVESKKERKIQRELKFTFSDSKLGSAQAIDLNGTSYIFTGDDSILLSDAQKETDEHIEFIKSRPLDDYYAKQEIEKAKEKLENEFGVIAEHLNPDSGTSITPTYGLIYGAKDFNSDTIKITSMNIMI